MTEEKTTPFERIIDRVIAVLSEKTPEFLLIGLLFIFIVARFTLHTFADPDLFTRLAVGRLIIEKGSVPLQDPFAFSTTKPIWHDHEILPGLLFYIVHSFLGDKGIFALKCLFCLLTICVLRQAQLKLGTSKYSGFWLLSITALLSSMIWLSTVRAQVFTYLFFAWFLYAFIRYRESGQRVFLYSLPWVMVLWVNSHGGFVLGFALFGIFLSVLIFERQLPLMPAFLSGLACCLATLINPYGTSFLKFIYEALIHAPSYVPTNPPNVIPEWLPVELLSIESAILLLLVCVILWGWSKDKNSIPLEGLGFLGLTLFLGMQHYRFLPTFFFVVATYGSQAWKLALVDLSGRAPELAQVVHRAVVSVAVLALLLSIKYVVPFSWKFSTFSLTTEFYPIQALDWLRNNYQGGNLLTDYNNGSYVLWRLYPRFKVSLDGRFDGVYPVETMDLSLAAGSCTNLRHLESLSRLNPDFILIGSDTISQPIDSCFPNYGLRYRDERYAVLVRNQYLFP